MEREILKELDKWREKPGRKPLILNGARQVGKTYILREFGRLRYNNVAYVNCDANTMVDAIFSTDYDIERIVLQLSALTKERIVKGETLIIFDEVQENPKVLNSLKYFSENAPEYHVAVAGSLLGISLHSGASFPVGKVEMLKMYPMSYEEFLLAMGEKMLVNILQGDDTTAMDALAGRLTDLLRQYYYVGGMPAVVSAFVKNRDLAEVRAMQKQILFDYRRDFSKHAPVTVVPRINMVWDSIPSQLAKENKKFIYGAMRKGARASEFEVAIQWLIDAGLVYKVCRVTSPSMPLKFYEEQDVFKLFTLDVGLMGAMVDVPAESILVADTMMTENRGAFTELYVMSQLKAKELPIYYYSSNDSRVEIDFIVQCADRIVPIEVKSSVNVNTKSLRTFVDKHPTLKALRYSLLPHKDEGWMKNVPLWGVGRKMN